MVGKRYWKLQQSLSSPSVVPELAHLFAIAIFRAFRDLLFFAHMALYLHKI